MARVRRAVAMEPESGEPYAALGGFLMMRERHEEAEKAFLEAYPQLRPDDIRAALVTRETI